MLYSNTREGRNQILDVIASLSSKGYIRNDKYNDSVAMTKVVESGKVLKKVETIRFVFNKEEQTIIDDRNVSIEGLEKARNMLFGWSSLNIESANAVKAGLFNETDRGILKSQFSDSEWNMKS